MPKARKRKSKNTHAVERKVILGPASLSVSVCDPVPQLDGCLNREAMTAITSEQKSNRIDTKVTCSSAGVSPYVLPCLSFAPVINTGMQCQRDSRKREALRRLNGVSETSNNTDPLASCSQPKLSALRPLIISVPASNMSVKPKRLSRSQRRRRNMAMRRLVGTSNAANSVTAKVPDCINKLSSSFLQSLRLGPCAVTSTCETKVTSAKDASSNDAVCGKMTLSPQLPVKVSSSTEPPVQDPSSASAVKGSNNDKRVCLTTTGSEAPQFVPELLLSFTEDLTSPSSTVCTLDSDDNKSTEGLSTNGLSPSDAIVIDDKDIVIVDDVPNMTDTVTSSVSGTNASNDVKSPNDVIDLKSAVLASIPVSDVSCHTLISTVQGVETVIPKPIVPSTSSSSIAHMMKIPVSDIGSATVSLGNSSSSSFPRVSTVSASGNSLNSRVENLTSTASANSQTVRLLPGIGGVNTLEETRKYSQTGLSPSDAIVIDDEDAVVLDDLSSKEIDTTEVHSGEKHLLCQSSSSGSSQCKNLAPVRSLSNSLSCDSGAVSNSSCSVSTSSTAEVCSSSQQFKISSYPVGHHSGRLHPYRNQITNRNCTSATSVNLMELLQCHTRSLYKCRPLFPKQPVNPHTLMAHFNPGKPAFVHYSGTRSTPADVERIFGEMSSSMTKDDHTDVAYTANDVERFDERKRMAKELDKIIGDAIVID